MEKSKPEAQHLWLQKLVGNWTATGEMPMGPDAPAMTWSAEETVRPIGDVWIQGESTSQMPDGSGNLMVITLGYNPATKRFVGTWLGSMMTHLWVYDGWLDESGKVLTLEADGPSFEDPTKTETYRDVITIVDDDTRTLAGTRQAADGTWQPFMVATYRRRKVSG